MEPKEIGHEARAINQAFDEAGIGFKADRATVLAAFKSGGERSVTFDESGLPFTKFDGEILPLAIALHRFGHDHRDLVDGRTLPRQDQGLGRPGAASKSDFLDVAAKSKWISENGIEAYERLPLRSPKTSEVVYREDFWALPRAEKVARLAKNPGIAESLPSRPKKPFAELEANIEKAKSRHRLELDRLQAEQLQNF